MESLEIGYHPLLNAIPFHHEDDAPDTPSPAGRSDGPAQTALPTAEPTTRGKEYGMRRIEMEESLMLDEIVVKGPGPSEGNRTGGKAMEDGSELGEIVCERPPTIAGDTKPSIVSAKDKDAKSKKRRREDTSSKSLLLIEPPRQSIRNRINMEYPKPKEPLAPQPLPRTKKTKLAVKLVAKEDTITKDKEKTSKKGKRENRRKDRKARDTGESKMEKKIQISVASKACTLPSRPSSHAFGSLEAMCLENAGDKTSSRSGMSLEARLLAKKRKVKVRTKKIIEATDPDIPLLQIDTIESHETEKRGIPSSVFAHVMRLVADLPPIQAKVPRVKRRVPDHRPEVWAQSRQELCEALPYYRAFQSGLYLSQGVAFGYLLDGFPAPRDVCAHNGRVIISHGGGQCVRPTLDDGRVLPPVLAGDQLTTDFRVSALVRAWQRRVPLVLIAGSGYELLPFKLNCSYAVLGWYWVSLVWTESEPVARGIKPPVGRKWFKRVKVRFDWVQSQGQPWWERSAGPAPTEACQPNEIILSPQAKRISVSALSNGWDQDRLSSSVSRPTYTRRSSVDSDCSSISTSSGRDFIEEQIVFSTDKTNTRCSKRRRHSSRAESDASSALTPLPETPASTCLELPVIIGSDITESDMPMAARLPGDYCMAAFEDEIVAEDDGRPFTTLQQHCRSCHKPSPKIYSEGWICLETTCSAYWMLDTTIGLLPIPPGIKLAYYSPFLCPAKTPVDVKPPYSVILPKPKGGIPDETGSGDSAGSRGLWKGWMCENCGRANCRFRWEVWQCLGCQKLLAPIDPYSAVIPALSLISRGAALLGNPKMDPQSGISVTVRRITNPPATVMVYTLPHQIGTIYHVVNDCTKFADGIFDRYQREAASTRVPLFQRRPLNAIRGQLLAQHFAVNSGASYKYNVDSLSLSFDDSPSCVMQALDAITIRTERVVGARVDFNEVLSVLYREGQKMSWHDDGEPGLGPVVAGLSLGSDAIISWRKKSVHTAANATFNKGLPDPRNEPTPAIALSLTTSHGDIVMMQGRDMQKKYVHRVIPSGFRVAATARVIGK